jgi:hypothetical protein
MRNRIQEYFRGLERPYGNDGACTDMGKRGSTTEADAPKGAPAHVVETHAQRTARLLTFEIGKRWKRKDAALAKAAQIHPSGLSVLKTKGTEAVTPSLRAVCGIIGIDPDRLIEGEIIEVEPSTRRPDLHAMLESVVGTPDEPAVEQVLRAFLKARKH